MRSTMRDVAEAAGVSAMAVSVVLNGTGQNVTISPEKAERIRRAARELKYKPNSLARSLRNRRTGMVAVVFQHLGRLGQEHPYHAQLLNGVMGALFPNDYTLSLCPRMIQKGDTESISDGRFDGVLWCRPDFTEASLESIQASSVPVVMMHAPPGAVPGVSAFCADNHGALRQAVQHLASLNHRHVAFAIDPWNEKTVEGQVRAEAFLEAAKRCSFWNPEILVIDRNVQDLSRYARSDRPHTALICFSDDLAGFVLTACQELGIDVPNELSVVGFDSSSFCESTKPRLTSISQPVERMALDATNHLLSLIFQSAEGVPPSPIVSQIYDCGLEIRDSTGPPAIS